MIYIGRVVAAVNRTLGIKLVTFGVLFEFGTLTVDFLNASMMSLLRVKQVRKKNRLYLH